MLLSVTGLRTSYRSSQGDIRAVDGVDFSLDAGQVLGIVGESGCGKTTLGRTLVRVLDENAHILGGAIWFRGRDLLSLSAEEMRTLRWKDISLVPQAAMNSLDPVYRVGDQFLEVLTIRGGMRRPEARERSVQLSRLVGLDPKRLRSYPHELSGGMKQRLVIAMALALHPSLVIADEPVTALDVIIQHQVMNAFRRAQRELGLGVILITHDIALVAHFCDMALVMYAGKVLERGTIRQVLKSPYHPYTMGLQRALPRLTVTTSDLVDIPGVPPSLMRPPPGCRFFNRCPFATTECEEEDPPAKEPEDGHLVACWKVDDVEIMRVEAGRVSTWQRVIPRHS